MKLIGMLTTYQNEQTLPLALRSLSYLDGVVAVEGAYLHAIQSGQPARSTDNTIRLLREFVDSNTDVYLFHANEQDDTAQRNFALNKIRELFGNDVIVFIIDGDESYTEEQISEIRRWSQYIYDSSVLVGAHIWSRVFVTDEQYRLMVFPRIYKLTSDCYFFDDNRMIWPSKNIKMNFTDRDEEGIIVLPIRVAPLHYSYNVGRERFEIKRQERLSRHGKFVWIWDEVSGHPIRTDR